MKKLVLLLLIPMLVGCGHTDYVPEPMPTSTTLLPALATNPYETTPLMEEMAEAKPQSYDPQTLEAFISSGYTKEQPLTDIEAIGDLFTALEGLLLSNFDKVGWYHMTCGDEEITWVHVSQPEEKVFDQLLWLRDYPFYSKVHVSTILIESGAFGGTVFTDSGMNDYAFVERYVPSGDTPMWQDGMIPEEKILQNLDYYAYWMHFSFFEVAKRRLRGEEGYVNELYPENTREKFTYSAWLDSYEGQDVIVVKVFEDFLVDFAICSYTGEFCDYDIETIFFSLKDGSRLHSIEESADVKGTILPT